METLSNNVFTFHLQQGLASQTLLRWDLALSLFCMSSSERGHVYQHTALLPTALSDVTIECVFSQLQLFNG